MVFKNFSDIVLKRATGKRLVEKVLQGVFEMGILNFVEAREAYVKNSSDESLLFCRKYWDSYPDQYLPNLRIESGKCALENLRRVFGKTDYSSRVMRPLGDFKSFDDPATISREDIYSGWVARLRKKREFKFVDSRGEVVSGDSTFLAVVKKSFYDAQNQFFGKPWYDDDYFFKGLSMMLYASSNGVLLEAKVIRRFQKIWVPLGVQILPARPEDESDDVDMLMVLENGKIGKVSIKNNHALGVRTIMDKREKGKTKPFLYSGFKDGGLKYLTPAGKDIPFERVREVLGV